MESSDGSNPPSLHMIRAAELFPKPPMETEDSQLTVPFQELAGESVKYLGRTDDGVLGLSTYRIFMLKSSTNSETSVPLGLIETVQTRDLFQLIINCKDASTVKCSFETAEQCADWQRRIQLSVGVPETLESLFAFPFHSYMCDALSAQNGLGGNCVGGYGANTSEIRLANGFGIENCTEYLERLQRASRDDEDFMCEVARLGFDLNGAWRISKANEEFKLCPSYPQKLLVPGCISDDMLHEVAKFRGSRRLPAVVWRHRKSGAVIARCSQPEVGWFGWRNTIDEHLLKALADACAFDRGEQMRRLMQCTSSGPLLTSGESSPSSADSHEEVTLDEVQKVLIVDARSYTSAVTNRARGGGCECIEYYPCAEIEFMNLGNIHVIRKSFHSIRQLCASPPDCPTWLSLLEKTGWLHHLSGLLTASVTVCHAIEKKGRPVLVHCSDGWDRTPQIAATAQLCLDPFYRTVEGFRILVEREWLSFGHKFSDRCGHGPGSEDINERCPVFLQWLDLVHQIHRQFPCSFEFSMAYLIKLAQHSHSCLFGTFLCNTYRERVENSVFERTFSVWPFLSGPMYKNPLYLPNRDSVIWPAHHVRDLHLWTDVYLGSLGNQNNIDFPTNSTENLQASISPMAKTRSYGDLMTANIMQNGISRRSSDPNMIVEPNLTMTTNSENNSIADIQSEREDSPDNIHETTRKIEKLTVGLNDHDEANFMAMKTLSDQVSKNASKLNKNATNTPNPLEANLQDQTLNNNNNASFGEDDSSRLSPTLSSFHPMVHNLKDIGISSKLNNISNIVIDGDNASQNDSDNGSACNAGATTEIKDSAGVENLAIYKSADIKEDLMQSVDLNDMGHSGDGAAVCEEFGRQNIWHGSVNTSTDTLVPVEARQTTHCSEIIPRFNAAERIDTTDGIYTSSRTANHNECQVPTSISMFIKQERKSASSCNNSGSSADTNDIINNSILPKVHGINSIMNRSNILSTSSSNASVSSTSSSLNNLNHISNNYVTNNSNNNTSNNCLMTTDESCDNKSEKTPDTDAHIDLAHPFSSTHSSSGSAMNESIIILPEHRRLEISMSGPCETLSNNGSSLRTTPVTSNETDTGAASEQGNNGMVGSMAGGHYSVTGCQRRRRTSSSNSNRPFEGIGSATTRASLPGVRSLPMTPPGLPERPQVTISCPDGLAHALSEQNLRLQQIVLEHKVREDVLLREIHDMRMALLKKICPSCNIAQTATNDEQCSAMDNIENASICSWEAVEGRNAPSPSASSTLQQPHAASVLWVPDHAVKRCTSCQVEFWIGRRRHHCRSCGQIFCADCSEFWAPLPDAKFYNPVRLCGPCYHAVTTRIQQQSRSAITTNMPNHITTTNTSVTTTLATTVFNSGATLSLPITSTTVPTTTLTATAASVTATTTTLPASCTVGMTALPTTAVVLQQNQQRQSAAATASAAMAAAAAAAAAATGTQIEGSSMSHILMANKIAASVAN